MSEKKIVISGQLNLDASKAAKALEDISKKFKSFEKSAFTKQMEDLRKIQPLIKDLDKGLSKMMQSMSKSDAKSRIKELNQALKQQADELKKVLEVQEKLNRSIKAMPEGSAKDQAKKDRDDASYKARALMGSMEQFGSEREELKKIFNQDFIKKIAQGVQMTAGIASGISNYLGNRELTRLSLEAQSSGFGNMVGSMSYGKNIDLGMVMASGKLGNINKAMEDKTSYDVLSRGGRFIGGVAGGAAEGGIPGALGAAGNELAKNTAAMDFKEEFFGAMRSQAGIDATQSVLSETAFPRELMNMLIDQAPMKVAAIQGMVGAGKGAFGKNLGGLFSQNYRKATRFGVEMPEAAGMMQLLGQSGAIGAERGDITGMLQARNAGVAQPGEFAGMVAGMSKVSGDGSKNVSMVRKAIEEGVRSGVDRSMVKSLVRATEEVAGSQSMQVQNAENMIRTIDDLKIALGGKTDLSKVGAGQLDAAKSALEAVSEHTKTPLGMATQNMVYQEYVDQLGGSQMSPETMIALSKMGTNQRLEKGTDIYDQMLEVFGGDEEKLEAFNARKKDLNLVGMSRIGQTYSGLAEETTTLEGLDQFRQDLQSDDPAIRAAAQKRARDRRVAEGLFYDKAEVGAGQINLIEGESARSSGAIRGMQDESGQTGAGGLARYRAALESLQQAAAGQKEVQEKMREAMAAQLKAAQVIAESPILKTMEDGTAKLTISMDTLKESVDRLNETMGGKNLPDRQARKEKEARKEYNERQKTIEEDYAKGNYAEGLMGDLFSVPDYLGYGIDNVKNKINNMTRPPKITPNNK